MKPIRSLLAVVAMVVLPAMQTACASPPPPAVSYNFGWATSGADQARPFQVFDDGQHVYVQFDDPKRVPAIFADTPGGRILLSWDLRYPYVVIDHPEHALIFRAGQYEARALRNTSMGAPEGVKTGQAAPVVVTGQAAMPQSRAALELRHATTESASPYGQP